MNIMSDLLTAFPKIDAVWAVNDPTALGAELAIKQAKRDHEMFVVGVDQVSRMLWHPGAAKQHLCRHRCSGSILHGLPCSEVGWEILNGKKPENEFELIPVTLITQEGSGRGLLRLAGS